MLLSVFACSLASLAQLVSCVCVFCSISLLALIFLTFFGAELKQGGEGNGALCTRFVDVLKQKLITYTQRGARS